MSSLPKIAPSPAPPRLALVGEGCRYEQRWLPLNWLAVVGPPEPENAAPARIRLGHDYLRKIVEAGLELDAFVEGGDLVVEVVATGHQNAPAE